MFGRLLWKLLRSNRGRLAVALVAVVSGAAVVSALLTVELDVSRKLTQEFRLLGPNVMVAPRQSGPSSVGASAPVLMSEDPVRHALQSQPREPGTNVGAEPFLYIVAQLEDAPVVVGGTDLGLAGILNPTWKFDSGNGAILTHAPDVRRRIGKYCYVGRNVSRRFHLELEQNVSLDYQRRQVVLPVAGILDSGGAEDNQILTDLTTVQDLAGLPGQIELEQIRVDGNERQIAAYVAALRSSLPQYEVMPIRAITNAEGDLLSRTRLLVVSMIVLIMVLTALCVLATMTALATERRADVGLMKALGGTITRIVGLFLAELGVLGAAGGLVGCALGMALAEWMGRRVFGTAVAPRWEIFPLTIGLMVVVAMAGALPLQALGKVKPAVILRGE